LNISFIIEVVKQTTPMFNKNLQPIYEGRVLVNDSAMNDPIVQAALKEMSLRNFEPLPTPNEGVWNISDRD
tara:strand:- start:153 stop:365 length:213 start_codon:yes stop_codon:yes gene_type:complete